jgi:hypothetical protein
MKRRKKKPTCAELSWTHSALGASGSVKFMLCDCNAIDFFLFFFYFLLSIKFIACEKLQFFLFFSFFFLQRLNKHIPTLYVSEVMMMMMAENKKKSNKTEQNKIKLLVLDFKLRI